RWSCARKYRLRPFPELRRQWARPESLPCALRATVLGSRAPDDLAVRHIPSNGHPAQHEQRGRDHRQPSPGVSDHLKEEEADRHQCERQVLRIYQGSLPGIITDHLAETSAHTDVLGIRRWLARPTDSGGTQLVTVRDRLPLRR